MCKLYLLVLACMLLACSKKSVSNKTNYSFTKTTTEPDYTNLDYWAAHPKKADMSDNVPKALGKYDNSEKQASVFFIHPTTLTDVTVTTNNADVNDSSLNKRTDESTILFQASVFNESCNVYAPRYRQAHYRNFLTDQAKAKPHFDLAYADVKIAFEQFLKENADKPFIIASHSQGTVHAGRLIKEMIEGKPLAQKLIAAYLIGMPIKTTYFSQLQPCNNPTATGCFNTWRTYKAGFEGETYIAKETDSVWVTNPLTWTLDDAFAPKSLNKGGLLRNFNKVITGIVDAQKHKNILWATPHFFGANAISLKNYHIADYNLFYVNIRENVKERIEAYWKR